MGDDHEAARGCAFGKRFEHRPQRRGSVGKRGFGAQLEVGRQLQGKEEVAPSLGREPRLCRRRYSPRRPPARRVSHPAGVFGNGMVDPVAPVMRVERPTKGGCEIVRDVMQGQDAERRREARREIGFGKCHGEHADRLGLARKPRAAGHPVPFERQPIRPHIAQIGDKDREASSLRRIGGDDMVGPSVAE
jgi:hypothetical protein